MLIDFVLTFLAGLLIGLGIQKRRVIFVKETERTFHMDAPEVPADVRAQLQLHKSGRTWHVQLDEEDK